MHFWGELVMLTRIDKALLLAIVVLAIAFFSTAIIGISYP